MRDFCIKLLCALFVAGLAAVPSVASAQNAARELMKRQQQQQNRKDDPFNTEPNNGTSLDQIGANPYADPNEEQPADTTKRERRERKPLESYFFSDSVRSLPNFRWHIEPGLNRVEVLPLDTALHEWRVDYPYLQQGVGDVYLGNLGAATIPIDYDARPDGFDFWMARPFASYAYTLRNVDFYNVKKPFTHLTYITSGQKRTQEENFQGTHAQNVSPSTGFNVDYKSRGTRGIYTWQQSRAKDLSLVFQHTGRRYAVHAGYIYNAFNERENGGVVGDWAVADTVFELPSNVPTKFSGDANDPGPRNRIRNNTFYLVQSYGIPLIPLTEEDFTMADRPAVYIGHALEYSRWARKYTDTREKTTYRDERDDSGGETTYEYYRDWFINPDRTIDSTFESLLSNRFFVQVQPYRRGGAVGVVDAGIGIDNHRYSQFTLGDYLRGSQRAVSRTSYYIYGKIDGKIKRWVDWSADVRFFPSGYRGGDLEAGGSIGLTLYLRGRPLTLRGRFENVTRSPNYWQENYFSNHYVWSTPLRKENKTRLEVSLDAPAYGLELRATYNVVSDPIYLDADCLMAQHAGSVTVTGVYARKDFRLGGLHLDNRVLLQWSTNQQVIPVPTVGLFLSYYYEFNIVKNVLRMQLGLDGRYNSKFYAFGYNPALAQFYNQREKKVGGYPMVDVFASAKWKRMRIIIKMQHVNDDLFGGRNYFSALHYPLNARVLKIGFSWGFYD